MLTRLGLAAKVDVVRDRFFGCDAGEHMYHYRHARDPLGEASGERDVLGCQNYHQEFYIGYVAEAGNLGSCVTGSAA